MVCCASFASEQVTGKRDDAVFHHENISGTDYYTKRELSGCVTKVRLRADSSRIDLSYGGGCEAARAALESVSDVARSFTEIIEINALDEIKKT